MNLMNVEMFLIRECHVTMHDINTMASNDFDMYYEKTLMEIKNANNKGIPGPQDDNIIWSDKGMKPPK